ncbi:hypothetical protein ACFOSC_16580 [Streptantibioticus rubrisoli]|uniref:Uncharacterized protein n=1 Tax=Streptantibioticus rubrisoli TaxID=1387313 RepID=A0ABT1PAM5_9ACTN|nr:hypothetical protein [Streptantibioticus rubrisoli]MCQ4042424.1 hypothetical protein [Streptantibioticus rubrisoli]
MTKGISAEVIAEVEKVAAELAVVNSMIYLNGVDYTGPSPGVRIEWRPNFAVRYLTVVRDECIYALDILA